MISIIQCKDSVSKSRELDILDCVGLSYVRQWFWLAATAAVIERVRESSKLEWLIYCLWFASCSPCVYAHASENIRKLGQYLPAVVSRCLQYSTDYIKVKMPPCHSRNTNASIHKTTNRWYKYRRLLWRLLSEEQEGGCEEQSCNTFKEMQITIYQWAINIIQSWWLLDFVWPPSGLRLQCFFQNTLHWAGWCPVPPHCVDNILAFGGRRDAVPDQKQFIFKTAIPNSFIFILQNEW